MYACTSLHALCAVLVVIIQPSKECVKFQTNVGFGTWRYLAYIVCQCYLSLLIWRVFLLHIQIYFWFSSQKTCDMLIIVAQEVHAQSWIYNEFSAAVASYHVADDIRIAKTLTFFSVSNYKTLQQMPVRHKALLELIANCCWQLWAYYKTRTYICRIHRSWRTTYFVVQITSGGHYTTSSSATLWRSFPL